MTPFVVRMLRKLRGLPGLSSLPGGWLARVALAVYWLCLLLLTHWPKLDPHIGPKLTLSQLNLDKPMHASAFGTLAMFAILAGLAGKNATWRKHIITAALVVSGYAYLDELTQHWFQRTVCSGDLLANLVGIMAVCLGMLAASRYNAPGPWRRPACQLMLIVFAPLGAIVLLSPAMALEVDWPLWFMNGFMVEHGPRYVAMLALGAAVMTLGWFALPEDKLGRWRFLLGVLVAMLLAGGLLLACMSVNPALIWQDGVLWSLGAIIASIALGASIRAIASVRQMAAVRAAETSIDEPVTGDSADVVADVAADATTAAATDEKDNAADPATPAKPAGGSFVSNARTVSILTLVSRITGLVREAVIAGVFGLSPVAAAFIFAFQIPNLFRRLFGEGALAAAVIPVYARTRKEDPEVARRFVSLCLALLVVILGGLTLVGELLLVGALSMRSWNPDTALALRLTMVMLPYMPLVCLVALMGAVLQVRDKFASTAAVPIVLNIVVVAGTLLATWNADSPEALERSVYWVGVSVLVAGLLQVAWQLVTLLKFEKLTSVFTGTRPAMVSLKAIFLPMILGLAAFQINTFLDAVMAMGFSVKEGKETFSFLGHIVRYPMGEASVAALGWSQRLYEFPLGIFGIAIATAIFPALAHAAASRDEQGRHRFATIFHHGLRLSVFIGLPASIGLMIVALPLSRLAYERGEFGLADSTRVAWILMGYAPAIWAYSMNHVLTRAFYALGDSRTPLRVSLAMVALNLLLNLILVWPLGAMGFALATATGAVVQNIVLAQAIRRSVREPLGKGVWLSWGRSLAATLVMAAVLIPAMYYFDAASLSRTHSAMLLGVMVCLGGLVYLAMNWVLGCEEIKWLVKRKPGV